jgi:2-dehydrotetronate isomerase
MKPAANLSLLWPEVPYLDRFDLAAVAGFEAVEVLFPYDVAAKDTQRALLRNGLRMILMNAPPPNYTGGARGFAAILGGADRFRHDMRRAFRYAEVLNVPMIHVMAGEGEGPEAEAAMVENLKWAAGVTPEGITLLIEPLNPVTMPGYFLNDYGLAARVLDAVAAPNVALQYDTFHAQMIHGDAVAVWHAHAHRVAHVQVGDAPDRTAPGTGTVDFEGVFKAMRSCDYAGWVSGEYHPGRLTEETLDWMMMS